MHFSKMETDFSSFLFSKTVLIIEVLSFLFSPEHVEIICFCPLIPFFHPRDKSHLKRVEWEEKWKRAPDCAGHRGETLFALPSLFQ